MKHLPLPWLSFFLVLSICASAQKVITFDVPDATLIYPAGISLTGDVVGYYYAETSLQWRGFLRAANGKLKTFDAVPHGQTFAYALNLGGQVAGVYNTDDVQHGFIRDARGKLTYFDPPGVSTDIIPADINIWGQVAGTAYNYDDPTMFASHQHGFIRQPDGKFLTIDAGGADYPETTINAINALGQTTGWCDDFNKQSNDPLDPFALGHTALGFIRNANGKVTRFNVLNATDTYPVALNALGQVAGSYDIVLSEFDVVHQGFLRQPNGKIVTFVAPGAGDSTQVDAIDALGRVIGHFEDSNDQYHAFIRKVDGKITTFDVPGASSTVPTGVNAQGNIVGFWWDAELKQHGFVLK